MRHCLNLKQVDKVFADGGLLLIVLHEKHGERNVIAENGETFFSFFVKLLNERKEYGYFPEPEEPEEPSMTINAVCALPNGKVKDTAIKEIEDYNKSMKYYQEEKREFLVIKKAIEDGNGRLAYSILKVRSDQGAEYEEMTVEEPEYAE
jgi:hypothetical protein